MLTEIEISESGTCNIVCSFFPRNAPDYEDKIELMPIKRMATPNEIANYIFIYSTESNILTKKI